MSNDREIVRGYYHLQDRLLALSDWHITQVGKMQDAEPSAETWRIVSVHLNACAQIHDILLEEMSVRLRGQSYD